MPSYQLGEVVLLSFPDPYTSVSRFKLVAELWQYQEERQMPHITSIERLAKEEGIQEGRLETLQEDVLAILTLRFGPVSSPVTETINGLESSELLRQLLLRAVNTGSVEEFQQLLDQDLNRSRDL